MAQDYQSIGLGISETPYVEVILRHPSKFRKVNFDKIKLPKRITMGKNGRRKALIVAGSSSVDEKVIDTGNLVDMTDPYDATTRQDFAEVILSDPTGAPASRKRRDALFEDGLVMELEKSEPEDNSQVDAFGNQKSSAELSSEGNLENPVLTDSNLQPEEPIASPTDVEPLAPKIPQLELTAPTEYIQAFKKIKNWLESRDINGLHKMRVDNITSMAEGRSLTLIVPPISQLQDGDMPDNLKTISYEDLQSPVVDEETWKMVAIRLEVGDKMFALPDEYIYTVRNDDGLRKDSAYFGTSELEPIVTLSRGNKRAYNHDIIKALVSAYMQKIIVEVMTRGSVAEQRAQMNEIASSLLNKQNDIILLNTGTKTTPVPVSVDVGMVDLALRNIADAIISNIGVTKSQMMREFQLNRDLATVQEIAFIKYTRKPDEMIIADSWENQLLNPLLSHLLKIPVDELQYKIKIKIANTEELENKDVNPQEVHILDKKEGLQNDLQSKKEDEINSGSFKRDGIPIPVAGSSMSDMEADLRRQEMEQNDKIIKLLQDIPT